MRKYYKVKASRLNMRMGPGLEFEVIALLDRGHNLEQIGVSLDSYWFYVQTESGYYGWVSSKFLDEANEPDNNDEFPWFIKAMEELGVSEVNGPGDNPRIVEYLQSTSLGAPLNMNDETAWCSAFANWCVEKSGYEGTDSAWARDWLNWGVEIDEPEKGCVVVFTRGNGGHVGFFVDEDDENIFLLGGNQSDSVSIAPYPKSRLLGYRKI